MEAPKTRIGTERLEKQEKLDKQRFVNRVFKHIPGINNKSLIPRYCGRFIIGKDRPINNGIYIGEGSREALVADLNNSPTLQLMYRNIKNEISRLEKFKSSYKNSWELKILGVVSSQIQLAIPVQNRDPNMVESHIRSKGWYNDSPINVDYFFENKIGVCRHMALGAALILERLKEEQILTGNISIDRNNQNFKGNYIGHAWVRYVSKIVDSEDCVIILDPALGHVGYLRTSISTQNIQRDDVLNYARDTDYYQES